MIGHARRSLACINTSLATTSPSAYAQAGAHLAVSEGDRVMAPTRARHHKVRSSSRGQCKTTNRATTASWRGSLLLLVISGQAITSLALHDIGYIDRKS